VQAVEVEETTTGSDSIREKERNKEMGAKTNEQQSGRIFALATDGTDGNAAFFSCYLSIQTMSKRRGPR
jgi:hypothetical protein